MAWFRPMGADEVAYHEATVLCRADDHPGRALDYYGFRGETPLRWGGTGAERLGLSGAVTAEAYEAVFGPGGIRDPSTGHRLVASRRPGFELVVGAHKSVALLGVVGRADAMHSILDVETSATMAWLDGWFQDQGGRRGRAQVRTSTGGLTFATTRHATSRAGDPSPHDHVLVANVVEMLDVPGGYKGLDSAAVRDTVEAATMVGRLHAAARAVELGFEIAPDHGPSGNLRHWRVVGVPAAVCDLFSKRSDEITDYLAAAGLSGYRARSVAARHTRTAKRGTGTDQLLPGWEAELDAAGWPVERLAAQLHHTRGRVLAPRLSDEQIDRLAGEVLDVDGELLRNHKVFTRTNLVAAVAPMLYGHDPSELSRVIARITAGAEVVPLVRVAGAREQAYTTAAVLATEHAIAQTVDRLADRPAPAVDSRVVAAAVAAKEAAIGQPLSAGQRDAVRSVCASGRAIAVVVGVAGSGKTTALDAATSALAAAGYRVLGTSTSGQATRTLAAEAGVEARTLASLLWRLDHGHVALDDRTVVVCDETGMADDADLARLALGVERAGARLVLVGDHHQLSAIGPGGALQAVLDRRPELVTTLDGNVRQHDPAERRALVELRAGSVPAAVAWYAGNGRILTATGRAEALIAMADGWAADVTSRHDTALLAWRRDDVADLNRLARAHWRRLGRLTGPEVTAPGGRTYAAGDRVVALAPNPPAGIVTSQQLTVAAVDPDAGAVVVDTGQGRLVVLFDDATDGTHLDHGYALTVHRCQGATYDRAHVLGAGGGRELAYVAMSRARQRTTVHTIADDLAHAVETLQSDWGAERGQRWVSATATPGRAPAPAHPTTAERLARLGRPNRLDDALRAALRRQVTLKENLDNLRLGTGRWQGTVEGDAARRLVEARRQHHHADGIARSPGLGRRNRRAWQKAATTWAENERVAQQRWDEIGGPVALGLGRELAAARADVADLRRADLERRLSQSREASQWRDVPGREPGRSPSIAERLQRYEAEPPGMELGL